MTAPEESAEAVGQSTAHSGEVAGRELDLRVAIEVMGARWRHEPRYPGGPADLLEMPKGLRARGILAERRCSDGRILTFAGLRPYSRDIAAAWEVVEAMNCHDDDAVYREFQDDLNSAWYGTSGDRPSLAALPAEAAALRICRAALAALAAPTNSQPASTPARAAPGEENERP
jgi:hypothetical protein